ncbi:hypothetical protein SCLCIDRAFT_46733, partial [Scleroderma citrinum Foug A]
DEAISLHQSALDLRPAGHSDRLCSLHNLAVCFSNRYDKQGTIADLEANTVGRAALELHSPGHSDRAITLSNLTNDTRHEFLKFGTDGDLDETMSLHRSALDFCPVDHSDQLTSLNQLANCLSSRFE